MSPKDAEIISGTYKKERGKLLGYIKNRIPVGTEAEDILQDVFYQLTVGFNDIRRLESISSWLYRAAGNRITDLFRKKKIVRADLMEKVSADEEGPLNLADILPAEALEPDDEDLNDLIWQIIDKTLEGLPEEQSSVFIANEFDEKGFRELSDETGIPVNTLISRKRYAVLALRQNLKGIYKLLND